MQQAGGQCCCVGSQLTGGAAADLPWRPACLCILQVFSVTMRRIPDDENDRQHEPLTASVLRRKLCNTAGDGDEDDTCTVGIPAVGGTVLVVAQPPTGHSQPPEPCVLTAASPELCLTLIVATAVGVAMLMYGQRVMRTPAAVATIRISCTILPLLSALFNILVLLSMAMLSTTVLDIVFNYLPFTLPR